MLGRFLFGFINEQWTMKFTLAPAIIQLSAGSVNKNFHYAPRGGALVQITPKLSGGIIIIILSLL